MIESRGLESRRVHVLLRNCRLRDDVTGESVLQGRDRWTDVVIQGGTRVTDNVPVEPDRLEP
jgi:hypothetical protein